MRRKSWPRRGGRGVLLRVHRWFGLAAAAFLTVAGLTGSVIAFNHELDAWLNPELFHVPYRSAAISPYELAALIEREDARAKVTYLPLQAEPGHALVIGVSGRLDPVAGKPLDIGYNQVFFDPATGDRLGAREWGALRLDRAHFIPFLYALHYSLHLPERWGIWLMGAIAAAWVLDCFVGLWLTLPAAGSSGGRALWSRWKRAWKIKAGASRHRVNYDVHRAGGLWLWPLLIMFSISAVYLNLQFELFRPLLSRALTVTPHPFEIAAARQPTSPAEPKISFAEIVAIAGGEGERRGWVPPFDVFYSQEASAYGVGFGDHHAPGVGVPWLYLDPRDGSVIGAVVPGAGTPGDRIMQWMLPLHTGQILGLAGRIMVCICGVIVALLSLTGMVIWARKRKIRAGARMQFDSEASTACS